MHNPHFCPCHKTLGIGLGKNGYASGYSNNVSIGPFPVEFTGFPCKMTLKGCKWIQTMCQHRC